MPHFPKHAALDLVHAAVRRPMEPREPIVSDRTTSFLDWMAANGFRRFGEFSATGPTMAETLRGGSVYLFVLSGSPLYVGETGRPLRTRMTGLCAWMRGDPGALAARFRSASVDRSDIWARPERLVPTLDGEAPDRFAVEWLVIRRWCPPLNQRGALRRSVQALR